MIRLRSSSRCSRKLMAGSGSSCGSSPGGTVAAISGILRLGNRAYFGCRLGGQSVGGNAACRRLGRGKYLAFGLNVQLGDLRLDLGLKLVGSAFELAQGAPDLASY